jgi:serine/threonine protein kinase
MYDDKPVPKVIDFGVAKAIEQPLTEKSVYTQFGTLVGTFEYMSPEFEFRRFPGRHLV